MSMFKCGVREKVNFSPDNPKSKSVTHQSFAKDADINNIMSRYEKTGVLVDPTLMSSKRVPRFGDFSNIPDFAEQLNRINQAQRDFLTFPAAVRARFNNDVANALEFIGDPANLVEAVNLGFLPKSMLPKVPKTPIQLANEGAAQPPTA